MSLLNKSNHHPPCAPRSSRPGCTPSRREGSWRKNLQRCSKLLQWNDTCQSKIMASLSHVPQEPSISYRYQAGFLGHFPTDVPHKPWTIVYGTIFWPESGFVGGKASSPKPQAAFGRVWSYFLMIKIFRLECTTPLGPMLGCLTAGFCPSPRPKPPWKAMRNFQPCLPASLLNANVGNSMNDSQNAGLENQLLLKYGDCFFIGGVASRNLL